MRVRSTLFALVLAWAAIAPASAKSIPVDVCPLCNSAIGADGAIDIDDLIPLHKAAFEWVSVDGIRIGIAGTGSELEVYNAEKTVIGSVYSDTESMGYAGVVDMGVLGLHVIVVADDGTVGAIALSGLDGGLYDFDAVYGETCESPRGL